MEKIIDIDLIDKYDFVNRYDNSKVNNVLIEYLVKEAKFVTKKDSLIININPKFAADFKIDEMLISALKEEYINTVNDHYFNNLFQIMLFLLGIISLSVSALIDNGSIWKEILLIGGWVPIWEMIELELFNDVRGRKRKIILNRLINSKINIKK